MPRLLLVLVGVLLLNGAGWSAEDKVFSGPQVVPWTCTTRVTNPTATNIASTGRSPPLRCLSSSLPAAAGPVTNLTLGGPGAMGNTIRRNGSDGVRLEAFRHAGTSGVLACFV